MPDADAADGTNLEKDVLKMELLLLRTELPAYQKAVLEAMAMDQGAVLVGWDEVKGLNCSAISLAGDIQGYEVTTLILDDVVVPTYQEIWDGWDHLKIPIKQEREFIEMPIRSDPKRPKWADRNQPSFSPKRGRR